MLSQQVKYEITELASPTALQRFGAPFRSDKGEVAPEDSELPILRYIFVHHVRNFPFLDQAKEEEFWQAKLQVFLESFANKQISGSEDRLEETKRKKLAGRSVRRLGKELGAQPKKTKRKTPAEGMSLRLFCSYFD